MIPTTTYMYVVSCGSHRSACRQGVHAPAQAPDHYVAPYLHRIEDPVRRLFAGMLSAVDGESDLCCFALLCLLAVGKR